MAMQGTQEVRDEFVAVAVMVWWLLGLKLAFSKAQRGTHLRSIRAQIEIFQDRVVVSIPQARLEDLSAVVHPKMSGKSQLFSSLFYDWTLSLRVLLSAWRHIYWKTAESCCFLTKFYSRRIKVIADDSYSGSIVSILDVSCGVSKYSIHDYCFREMYRVTIFMIEIYPDMYHDTASLSVSSRFVLRAVFSAVARALLCVSCLCW